MYLASVRVITDQVEPMVQFYEHVTGRDATRYTPQFAEVATPAATLAIGHTDTVALFGANAAHAADSHTAIIEFRVDDVDCEFTRLRERLIDLVQEPTTMPWGNRSLLFRDPDGNLVNLFTPVTPVTPEAVAKYDA